MQKHIPIEMKAAVFDALVDKFQNRGRLVGTKRQVVDTKRGHNGVEISFEDIPVYEFAMRVDGHRDFMQAILNLYGDYGGDK